MRNELKTLGLSDKEIDVYVAGLKLGSTTINKLSQSARVKRSTVYVVLERLKQRGLVSQGLKRARKIYEMADPEKFLKLVKEEKEKIKEKEESVRKAVASLKVIANKSAFASDIKIYEGYDATMEVLVEISKTKSPTYNFYSSHYFPLEDYEKIKKAVAKFNTAKRMAKSKIYVITDQVPLTSKFFPSADEDIREFRFLPEDIKLPAMIDVNEDVVVLSSVRDGYSCIVIKNKTIADTLRIIHGIVWQSLENKKVREEKDE